MQLTLPGLAVVVLLDMVAALTTTTKLASSTSKAPTASQSSLARADWADITSRNITACRWSCKSFLPRRTITASTTVTSTSTKVSSVPGPAATVFVTVPTTSTTSVVVTSTKATVVYTTRTVGFTKTEYETVKEACNARSARHNDLKIVNDKQDDHNESLNHQNHDDCAHKHLQPIKDDNFAEFDWDADANLGHFQQDQDQ
ncbi:hypothetical protein ACM66B_000190 [Microbotryomycetes sp. NB124-2]